jgi:hypothetical protein
MFHYIKNLEVFIHSMNIVASGGVIYYVKAKLKLVQYIEFSIII